MNKITLPFFNANFLENRIRANERTRFGLLGILLLFNSIVMESNEVLATGGFANQVGATFLPWLWAVDMLIVMLTSACYSLWVDRINRNRLTVAILAALAVAYLALYGGFMLNLPSWLTYSILTILTDQQWLLVPMLVWALANDAFSTAAAKRLIPMLAMIVLVGQLIGNSIAAMVGSWLAGTQLGSVNLLLTNASILLLLSLFLARSIRSIEIRARQAQKESHLWENLREGVDFMISIPAFRFLGIVMILMGFALNIMEFHFIWRAAELYTTLADLQFFYGAFKIAVILLLVITQGWVVTRLIEGMGFKKVFGAMPLAMGCGLLFALFSPGIYGLALGNLITRVTLLGVDEPARHAYQGLVPDERRGRVSAVMDGYLYPGGAILSCGLLLGVLWLIQVGYFTANIGQIIYLGVGLLCAAGALWAMRQMYLAYDTSMLNWRLQRKRRASQLDNLNF